MHGVAQQGVCTQHPVGEQQVVEDGQQAVGPGQQTVGPGQQTVGPGQQTVGPGQQTVGPGQQTVGPGQQVVGTGQQGAISALPVAPFVPFTGGRQQGTTFGPDWGQRMLGTLPAAPAGLSIASTHNEAARKVSDDGTMRRRIAETGPEATRICET
jgi:hypothetical protein